MMKVTTNEAQFFSGLDRCLAEIEQKFARRVKEVVYFIDRKVHERTPVHSGQAVRNMIWSMGQANSATLPAIETPADPGYTSGMGLGSEPRRGANEAAARESLSALSFKNPFTVYWLSNNSPDIGLIEDGASGLPGKSRAPNGVFAITMADVIAKLKSGAPL